MRGSIRCCQVRPKKRGRPRKPDPVVMAELTGIVHGIVADGRVVQSEAVYLQAWLSEHASGTGGAGSFADSLSMIISEVLRDGVLDAKEAAMLLGVLGNSRSACVC